jgi:hypothetical protein
VEFVAVLDAQCHQTKAHHHGGGTPSCSYTTKLERAYTKLSFLWSSASLLANKDNKMQIQEVFHIKFQQSLQKGSWNTWKIPFMLRVLLSLSFIMDQYCWKQELPNIFLVEISGTEFQQNLWKALWDSDLLDFWTSSIIWYSRIYKAQRLGNWICFHLQVGGERHILCWIS